MVLIWLFLLFLFSSFLYFFASWDLGPVQLASASVFTTCGDKLSGCGVSPCAGSAEWLQYGTDWFGHLRVLTFAYVEWLFASCYSFLLFYRNMQPRGSARKEEDNVMARLHVTRPGLDNTPVLFSAWYKP
jgi:hypothetical protein